MISEFLQLFAFNFIEGFILISYISIRFGNKIFTYKTFFMCMLQLFMAVTLSENDLYGALMTRVVILCMLTFFYSLFYEGNEKVSISKIFLYILECFVIVLIFESITLIPFLFFLNIPLEEFGEIRWELRFLISVPIRLVELTSLYTLNRVKNKKRRKMEEMK